MVYSFIEQMIQATFCPHQSPYVNSLCRIPYASDCDN